MKVIMLRGDYENETLAVTRVLWERDGVTTAINHYALIGIGTEEQFKKWFDEFWKPWFKDDTFSEFVRRNAEEV